MDTDDDTEEAMDLEAARNNRLPPIRKIRGEGDKY